MARRYRSGQVSVEYMLLLCAMLTVALLAGTVLKDYTERLVEAVAEMILRAAFGLAS